MTDVGMAMATGCDCPEYPAEVERDCCCIGGTECIDGRRRAPAEWDVDHAAICSVVGLHTYAECKAPTPSVPEVGAASAIAGHSADGISRPPAIDPTVEAAGAARSSYLSGVSAPEVRLIHTLAVARLSLADDPAAFIEAGSGNGRSKTWSGVGRRARTSCRTRGIR